ncbi:hypothetical protein GE21DRAFT_2091 [Neurospora crassa]|uniref:Uncharacterized protein n=1 Tax=Neurospora crassa (strain ATCC 24698 / 74-OR23-1A / CBS 708.71 / DSM 1257 / FGSC 987) TaxID=367110 RepID=V5IQ59_NEUCR|nr:hypothetical protein NCU16447 [Neurospora crassa OR74A]ESA44298.1 hypothetical protein NCU16447 [Neurospora crassa OR74A]KHE89828.1 hypothetical protein GE21DRAFT_2091 [Neurospora crassa]|eukprot:XP_011393416.1 hypothetical protein NCU16447 [Neurospora crassa OR74A]
MNAIFLRMPPTPLLSGVPILGLPTTEHQAAFAAECCSLNAQHTSLRSSGSPSLLTAAKTEFTVPSTFASLSADEGNLDQIPVINYEHFTASPSRRQPCSIFPSSGATGSHSPGTSDAFSGLDPYMPLHFRFLHTSA